MDAAADEPIADPPTIDEATILENRASNRSLAKQKEHLLCHDGFNPECIGCQAKTRNKKHFKKSFDRGDAKYENLTSMDQVTLADLEGTVGIHGYKYALVICKVREDYWNFMP